MLVIKNIKIRNFDLEHNTCSLTYASHYNITILFRSEASQSKVFN